MGWLDLHEHAAAEAYNMQALSAARAGLNRAREGTFQRLASGFGAAAYKPTLTALLSAGDT